MSLIIIIVFVIVVFTFAGRWATPKRERFDLREWTIRDVYRNLVRGLELWAPLQDRLPLR